MTTDSDNGFMIDINIYLYDKVQKQYKLTTNGFWLLIKRLTSVNTPRFLSLMINSQRQTQTFKAIIPNDKDPLIISSTIQISGGRLKSHEILSVFFLPQDQTRI